jgi:hypothetical protein
VSTQSARPDCPTVGDEDTADPDRYRNVEAKSPSESHTVRCHSPGVRYEMGTRRASICRYGVIPMFDLRSVDNGDKGRMALKHIQRNDAQRLQNIYTQDAGGHTHTDERHLSKHTISTFHTAEFIHSAYSESRLLMQGRMPLDSPYTARSNGSTSDVPTS